MYARAGVPADAGPEPTPGEDAVIARLRASFDRVRRFGGGNHVVSKRIANNRRIPLLARAFPDARFVHLVRDGRAVAYSLAEVDWWESEVVWWCGRTPPEWEAGGADPWELCARHWVEEVSAVDAGLEAVPRVARAGDPLRADDRRPGGHAPAGRRFRRPRRCQRLAGASGRPLRARGLRDLAPARCRRRQTHRSRPTAPPREPRVPPLIRLWCTYLATSRGKCTKVVSCRSRSGGDDRPVRSSPGRVGRG